MIPKANPLFCLVFLYFSLKQLQQTKATSGNETDRLSLIALKDKIEGLSSWNQSLHFCQWQGIRCGKRHQRVISLNLSSQSLVGTLSPHIGNLSFLRVIYLPNNKFHGQIPQEIGQLSHLRSLKLWNNSFEGEIPVNLSRCTDLRMIDFDQNNLSGTIPGELGSLSNLLYLYFSENRLTGRIPASVGNLSSLGSNSLEGSIPETLGRLSSLRFFIVEGNQLSGTFPASIFNLTNITNFSIVSNQLTGSLPPDLGIKLPNLVFFATSGNHLSGPFPVSLANASKIVTFDISSNNFTGQVPNNLGSLKNLTWLGFSHNNLGRGGAGDLSFLISLSNSSNLKTLASTFNNFGGVFPISMSNFSNQIQTLYLGHNQIVGTIPEGLGNLVNLIGLGLEGNQFHGNIPPSLGNSYKLQALSLRGNELSGHIPSSLSNLTRLFVLDLSSNRLEGSIPSSLGGCRSLQILHLSENNLNGTIPREIFGLSSLSTLLDLSYNSFTGPLLAEVGNLKGLRVMNVSGNKLSGEIPSSLGDCSALEELRLENNLFGGMIPQSLSSLKGIRYIDLARNNLSGVIPKYLEDLRYLERLNLSFNGLEGPVPTKGIFGNASVFAVNGNFKLCGGIHQLWLPMCQVGDHSKKRRHIGFKLAISITVVLSFLVAVAVFIRLWRRKPKSKANSPISIKDPHFKVSYRDLFQATDGFSPINFVGSGSYGRVYRGMLSKEEMIVAVKVFNLQHKGASKTFDTECESMRNIRHRNLVKIITSCSSTDFEGNDFKALVFEFMPNRSLETWLHEVDEEDQIRSFNLLQRLNIAIDVACALNYLHHECHFSIIHRDLKPSNVLLDDDMVAHVSDFGLAKLLSESMENPSVNQSTSMGVKGSIGYTAPEYGMGGGASTQGDMYSYGILLLELFTGRRPTDEMFVDGLDIQKFATLALPNRVMEILDPALLSLEKVEEAVQQCLASVVRIGVACSARSPGERMDVEEVARELHLIRNHLLSLKKKKTVVT
ncbi:non-specific serine/threonine protein kinase [Ranunculus cassubicifolius]